MALPYWQISTCTVTANYVFDVKSCSWTSGVNTNLANEVVSNSTFMNRYNAEMGMNNFAPFQRIERNRDKQGYHYNQAWVGWLNSSYFGSCDGANVCYNMRPLMQFIGTDGTMSPGSKGDLYSYPCKTITDRCGCTITGFVPPKAKGNTSTSWLPNKAACSWSYRADGIQYYDGYLWHYCSPGAENIPPMTGRGWQGTGDMCQYADSGIYNSCASSNCGKAYCYGNVSGLQHYASNSATGVSVWNIGWKAKTCCCTQTTCMSFTLAAATRTPEDVFSNPTGDFCTTVQCYAICPPYPSTQCGNAQSMAFGGVEDQQEFWMYLTQSGGPNGHSCNMFQNNSSRPAMLVKMCAPEFGGQVLFTQKCAFFLPPTVFGSSTSCWNFTSHAYAICEKGSNQIYAKGETFDHVTNSFRWGSGNGACCTIKWYSNNWIMDTSTCNIRTVTVHSNNCFTPVDIEYTSRGTWLISYVLMPGCIGTGCNVGSNCMYPQYTIAVDEYNSALTSKLGTINLGVCRYGCCNTYTFPCSIWQGSYAGHKITYDSADDSFLIGVNLPATRSGIGGTSSTHTPSSVFARMPANLQTYAPKIYCAARKHYRYCCISYTLCDTTCMSYFSQDSYGQAAPPYHIWLQNCCASLSLCVFCTGVTCTSCTWCNATSSTSYSCCQKCRANLAACTSTDCCCMCHCRFFHEGCNAVIGQQQGGTHYRWINDFK